MSDRWVVDARRAESGWANDTWSLRHLIDGEQVMALAGITRPALVEIMAQFANAVASDPVLSAPDVEPKAVAP